MLTLRYNFTFRRIMGTFGIRAFTSPNAITPFLSWQGDKLVTSYENSNGLQNLSFFLSPQIEIIPNWLTASGTIQYRVERMKGNGYKLYNHNWSGDVTAMLQHWDFTLTAQYQKSQKNLWGETYSWGGILFPFSIKLRLEEMGIYCRSSLPFHQVRQRFSVCKSL